MPNQIHVHALSWQQAAGDSDNGGDMVKAEKVRKIGMGPIHCQGHTRRCKALKGKAISIRYTAKAVYTFS